MSGGPKCLDCERCTWNKGPDCGQTDHPHCPRCQHCLYRHATRGPEPTSTTLGELATRTVEALASITEADVSLETVTGVKVRVVLARLAKDVAELETLVTRAS